MHPLQHTFLPLCSIYTNMHTLQYTSVYKSTRVRAIQFSIYASDDCACNQSVNNHHLCITIQDCHTIKSQIACVFGLRVVVTHCLGCMGTSTYTVCCLNSSSSANACCAASSASASYSSTTTFRRQMCEHTK
jgi:hypothetical protein